MVVLSSRWPRNSVRYSKVGDMRHSYPFTSVTIACRVWSHSVGPQGIRYGQPSQPSVSRFPVLSAFVLLFTARPHLQRYRFKTSHPRAGRWTSSRPLNRPHTLLQAHGRSACRTRPARAGACPFPGSCTISACLRAISRRW